MTSDEEPNRISRNIMIDKKIDDYIEAKRIRNKGTDYEFVCSRSDTWNDITGEGVFFTKIRDEYGQAEYEKIKALLTKLNLKKVDISKLI